MTHPLVTALLALGAVLTAISAVAGAIVAGGALVLQFVSMYLDSTAASDGIE